MKAKGKKYIWLKDLEKVQGESGIWNWALKNVGIPLGSELGQ